MEEEKKKSDITNHFEAGANCQVFNGPISGCVFAMPGANVTQNPVQPSTELDEQQQDECTAEPTLLCTLEKLRADVLWQRLCESGMIDEDNQPTVSRPEAALIADVLAARIKLRNKWKFFEQLWHRNNMRNDYNTALNQRKTLEFRDKLKNLLG